MYDCKWNLKERREAINNWDWNDGWNTPSIKKAWNENLHGPEPIHQNIEHKIKKEKSSYYEKKSIDHFNSMTKYGVETNPEFNSYVERKYKGWYFNPVDMEFELEYLKVWTPEYSAYTHFGVQQQILLQRNNKLISEFEDSKNTEVRESLKEKIEESK